MSMFAHTRVPKPERGAKCDLDDCHWLRTHIVRDMDGDLHDLCEYHTVQALESDLVLRTWAISDILRA